MAAPALVTIRIIDGRQGMTNTYMVKSRVFQLTTDGARATPNVVNSI